MSQPSMAFLTTPSWPGWTIDAAASIKPRIRWIGLAGLVAACAASGAMQGVADPVAMAAILVAAVASSIAGFAFAAISGAMLFHILADPVEVVRIMMACSIANQAAMTWTLRRDVDWRELRRFLLPGLAGVPVGVLLLLHADHRTYTVALGVPLAAYGLWMLLRPPIQLRRPHPVLDAAVAFLGGITGGAAAFPSGPMAIWCATKGWDKRRQRAVFQPYILTLQVAALAAISLTRPHLGAGWALDASVLIYVPAGLLGTAIGIGLFGRVSDRQFACALNALLIVSGLSFLT